ncbi:PTS system galactitol-specific EIIA component (Gat family) [Cricetibacter osteomyelitidis]|uniref:PTS system galactitol-specific EIIA component (Gat family) n=1 Tax=Cricetibacter osteomyelitidis TaxID=1521931 RepID=A0A4R2T8T5_9PAST|nr:PTS galactitol transporter subunit IIA [Cricetibacter osteomyelitidis]TCP97284.1 PTS system galactitol-specific EIIA component (Gat family) [Cricetibacter osteomyelitidis]
MQTEVLIKTDISFDGFENVLNFLADELIAKGIVKESYRQSVIEREEHFPTGIALEHYAVAIPHCEAEHALKPAIYFIRPNDKVNFNRADGDGQLAVDLIIALVVTDPQQQLKLLRTLFGKLQDNEFVERLLAATESELPVLINQNLNFN